MVDERLEATLDMDTSPTRAEASALASAPGSLLDVERAISGRYTILGLLGSGGMGHVYKVHDTALDEVVALKTLHPQLAESAAALERFRREVKLARRVTHPNVARVYDLGVDAQAPYLTMEFVQGVSLRARMSRPQARWAVGEVLDVVEAIAQGLAAAHTAGVIHRDLKPANVMLSDDGRVVLTDFGIARAVRASEPLNTLGGMAGTPVYMAPEQVEGAEVDPRADLYALGVVCYELLAGEAPFVGESFVAVALARLSRPAPRLEGVPEPLAALVARMLERDPQARYASVEAALEALREARAQLSRLSMEVGALARRPAPVQGAPAQRGAAPEAATRVAPRAEASPQRAAVRLAVLPFDAPEPVAYLAEGFAEELVAELSMMRDVRVRPMAAAVALGGVDDARDAPAAGARLGVDVVVSGRLRVRGDRVRVRVALVSVVEGFQIWGRRFEGDPRALFSMAEDAAEAIAQALPTELHEAQRRPKALSDPVAVELYMRARHTLHAHWFSHEVAAALDLFERALERAPDDPRVLTGAATARSRLVFLQPEEAVAHLTAARAYALKAVQLAPEWADPRFALAIVAYNSRELVDAARYAREAIALEPEHLDAHDLLGRIMSECGPLPQAIAHLRLVLDLNPNFYRARWDLARALALAGDWDGCDALLAQPVPDDAEQPLQRSFLIRLKAWRRDVSWVRREQLEEMFTRAFKAPPLVALAVGLADRGHMTREELDAALAFVRQLRAGQRYLSGLQLVAEFATLSGCDILAVDAVESAVDAGFTDLMWMLRCPLLSVARDDPRWPALVQRVEARVALIQAQF